MSGSSRRSSVNIRARVFAAVVSTVGVGTAVLLACGPYFPEGFLSQRAFVLDIPLAPSFVEEVRRLVPAPADSDRLKAVEITEVTTESIEETEFGEPTRSRIVSIRQSSNAGAAFNLSEGLAPALRHYTAGAVGFHNGQLDLAQEHFEAVLALPEDERRPRQLWAQFMLGRLAVARDDAAAAATHFEATRRLVRDGAPDPLGLAVASLGEEARLSIRPGRIARAISLYALQSVYGSASGLVSLESTLERTLNDEGLLGEAIRDRLARQLLFVMANIVPASFLSRFDDPDADAVTGEPPAGTPSNTAGDQSEADFREQSSLERIVAALERHAIDDREGIGWLAAQAYDSGRFELAERLMGTDRSAVSSWVRAKLAWRRGDTAGALTHYGEALASFRAGGASQTAAVIAETALLHIGRDEFTRALALFVDAREADPDTFPRDYWVDIAYLAERVLGLEELREFVDLNAPRPATEAIEQSLERGLPLTATELRALLARRLMRAGRYAEAVSYFDDEHVRSVAEEYVAALGRANSWWRGRVDRAEATYLAGTIARFDGMEILGYELAPDAAILDGEYPADMFEIEPFGAADRGVAPADGNAPEPAGRDAGLATAAELERFRRSIPDPNVRFHYRLTAVGHAMSAADLLPHSSQAFAAVLCRAAGWVIAREPERAVAVYARYLRDGAYVKWARAFGRMCPQPDFAAARRRVWGERFAPVLRMQRDHPRATGVAGLALFALPLILVARLARRVRSCGASGSRQ